MLKYLVASLVIFISSVTLSSERDFYLVSDNKYIPKHNWKIPDINLDSVHRGISKSAWWVSSVVDSIFSQRPVTSKPNRGMFIMSLETIAREAGVEFNPRYRLKIRLYNTKKLFKLNFSSGRLIRQEGRAPDQNIHNAGVETNFNFLDRIKVSSSTGIRLNDPIHWYGLLRTKIINDYFDVGFNLRYTTHSKYEFQQYISKKLSQLKLYGDIFWSEGNGLTFSQSNSYQLSNYPVNLSLLFLGEIDGGIQHNQTIFELNYAKSLYRKWLTYTIGAKNIYQKSNSWKGEFETYARIEGAFGGL